MPDTTHVANATRYTIWVNCDTDRTHLTEQMNKVSNSLAEASKNMRSHKDSGSTGGKYGNQLWNGELNFSYGHEESRNDEHSKSESSETQSQYKYHMQHVAASNGFTRIIAGESSPFTTDGPIVYVSIYAETGPYKIQYLCTTWPIARDRSVIVNWDGHTILQKYGAGLFIDENGIDYKSEWDEKNGLIVGIRGSNGKFVCGQNGQGPVTCDRDQRQGWETFTIEVLRNLYASPYGNGYEVALKSMGKYLSSENGERPMHCNRIYIGEWEKFVMAYYNGDGTFSLQGNNGKFVTSENGNGPMMCNRDHVDAWEKFVKVSRIDKSF